MEVLRVAARSGGKTNPRAATPEEQTRIMEAIAQESMARSRVQTLPDSMYQALDDHIKAASIAVFDTCAQTKYVIAWDEDEGMVTMLQENGQGELVVVADTAR